MFSTVFPCIGNISDVRNPWGSSASDRTRPMNTPRLYGRGSSCIQMGYSLILSVLLIPALLYAQQTDPTGSVKVLPEESNPDSDPVANTTSVVASTDDEIVTLPPFQVTPAEGWFAQDTFSGTRLRTPYKDLANQIETLTSDFMDDFALNTFEEATIYTLNVEARDNYVDGNGYENSVDGGFRIRGLQGVELTRLFFITYLPADRYNHNRIDISSGPNSILSASRGHAGSVNADPSPAVFHNGGKFGAQFDSFGSMRFRLDYNQVLVDDTLAVRGALLYSDRQFEVEPSYDKSRRLYGAVTYQPFKKTQLRAYYEYADLNSNKPPQSLPYETITPWLEASSLPESGYAKDRPIFQNDLEWQESHRDTSGQNVFRTESQFPVQTVDNGNSQGSTLISTWFNSVQVKPLAVWPHISPLDNRYLHTFLDDTYFPLDINVRGDTSYRDTTDHLFNLVFNQEITDGLYLEIAGQTERLDTLNAMGTGGADAIRIDANAFQPDGITSNPNVGKYYIQGPPFYDTESKSSNQARVTLSYEYDFSERHDGWSRWLGRHRLIGIASAERSERTWQRRFYRVVPEILANGDYKFPTIDGASWNSGPFFTIYATGRLQFRHYLDPPAGQYTASLPFRVGEPAHLVDSIGVPFTVDPENTGFYDEKGRRLTTGQFDWYSLKVKEDSYLFTYQGNFLEDRIILTYGRRGNDWEVAPFSSDVDFDTGMVIHTDDGEFLEPEFTDKGSAETWGIVLAPFRNWIDLPGRSDLSFFYQQSNSFAPRDAPHDPYGNRYPGNHGEGKDAGIQFSLADSRFVIRINAFKVEAGPEALSGNPYKSLRNNLANIEMRVRELNPELPILEDIPGQGFVGTLPHRFYGYDIVNHHKSTGYEISGQWMVNENLEFRFNAANQNVVRSDLGTEWWVWMDERLPIYQSLNVKEGGNDNPRDMDGDGEVGIWTWETAWLWDDDDTPLSESWEYDVIKGQNGRDIVQSIDGRSDPFVRDLRFNINGMYRFTEGSLKGLKLGGAVRWREAPLLSHGATTINGTEALDVNERNYGVSEWYLDLLARYSFEKSWLGDRYTTISLNILNALNHDDPVPFLTDTNGDPIRLKRVEGIRFVFSLDLEL